MSKAVLWSLINLYLCLIIASGICVSEPPTTEQQEYTEPDSRTEQREDQQLQQGEEESAQRGERRRSTHPVNNISEGVQVTERVVEETKRTIYEEPLEAGTTESFLNKNVSFDDDATNGYYAETTIAAGDSAEVQLQTPGPELSLQDKGYAPVIAASSGEHNTQRIPHHSIEMDDTQIDIITDDRTTQQPSLPCKFKVKMNLKQYPSFHNQPAILKSEFSSDTKPHKMSIYEHFKQRKITQTKKHEWHTPRHYTSPGSMSTADGDDLAMPCTCKPPANSQFDFVQNVGLLSHNAINKYGDSNDNTEESLSSELSESDGLEISQAPLSDEATSESLEDISSIENTNDCPKHHFGKEIIDRVVGNINDHNENVLNTKNHQASFITKQYGVGNTFSGQAPYQNNYYSFQNNDNFLPMPEPTSYTTDEFSFNSFGNGNQDSYFSQQSQENTFGIGSTQWVSPEMMTKSPFNTIDSGNQNAFGNYFSQLSHQNTHDVSGMQWNPSPFMNDITIRNTHDGSVEVNNNENKQEKDSSESYELDSVEDDLSTSVKVPQYSNVGGAIRTDSQSEETSQTVEDTVLVTDSTSGEGSNSMEDDLEVDSLTDSASGETFDSNKDMFGVSPLTDSRSQENTNELHKEKVFQNNVKIQSEEEGCGSSACKACSENYDPVCANNGKTYQNWCFFICKRMFNFGLKLFRMGPCLGDSLL